MRWRWTGRGGFWYIERERESPASECGGKKDGRSDGLLDRHGHGMHAICFCSIRSKPSMPRVLPSHTSSTKNGAEVGKRNAAAGSKKPYRETTELVGYGFKGLRMVNRVGSTLSHCHTMHVGSSDLHGKRLCSIPRRILDSLPRHIATDGCWCTWSTVPDMQEGKTQRTRS